MIKYKERKEEGGGGGGVDKKIKLLIQEFSSQLILVMPCSPLIFELVVLYHLSYLLLLFLLLGSVVTTFVLEMRRGEGEGEGGGGGGGGGVGVEVAYLILLSIRVYLSFILCGVFA